MSTPGTVGAWNAAMAEAPVADPALLMGEGGLVAVAPHPDDETIGCSALLMAAARLGRPVGIVAVTDGGGSHPGSRLFPPYRLGAVRVGEQEAAVAALGHARAEWLRLGLPDGASDRDPRLDDAAQAIADLCVRIGATALAAPHPDDPHPDHHAAARLARRVRTLLPGLRILFYEVWSRRLPDADPFRPDGLTPFRVATDVVAKRAALEHHASQLGRVVSDDPQGFVLPPWFLRALDDPLERLSWLAMPGEVPDRSHFARLYAGGRDFWQVRDSAYEIEKREAAVALLSERRHRRSLEAGCGEGYLTGALLRAGIVEAGVGFDRDPSIVERAARAGWGEAARFSVGSMPFDMPEGPFDLVILSEVLYFIDEATSRELVRQLQRRMVPGAHILVVAYLGPTQTPLDGRQAIDFFRASFGPSLRLIGSRRTDGYRMERLEWHPAPGAAPADGGEDPTSAAGSAGATG